MPRTRLQQHMEELRKQRPVVKVNTVTMIIKGYLEAAGLQSADVGPRLGLSASGFRSMLSRPESAWSIGDIEKVCSAINCPPEEIYQALAVRRTVSAQS